MWNIIGHEWAVDYLRQSIATGRDAHAYLISGPAAVGKALLALRLAQTLNCERGGDAPCLECRACKRIERGNHPDVRIAGMASQGAGLKAEEAARQKELKIGTVREWQRDISLKPYEGRRRVFILHDAERLNEESSNAMLKTLEEPPPYATLVLVANSADLLPTIVSRCQLIRLRPLPRRHVAEALQTRFGMEEADADLLAAWSGGRIGWALRMVETPDELQTQQEKLAGLLALHGQPGPSGFRWAEERAKEYRNGEQETVFGWLELWQSWWRDVLLTAANCPQSITHVDRRDELTQAARRYPVAEVFAFVRRIGDTNRQLRENVNPQLALENLLLHMPGG
ncbi:MAG: DNA polymerase III subunit delta' [Chloroflexaceae bacterium]|jgi:DNA polymerase-3 subunit delta'|nr:DNA polymerase III subunit delta' [Chloroflexaceae bacterium]